MLAGGPVARMVLGLEHPALLLQVGRDRDQQVLGDRVGRSRSPRSACAAGRRPSPAPTPSAPRPRCRAASRPGARQREGRGDGLRAKAVRRHAQRGGTLGHRVRVAPGRGDHLVQLEVDRPEPRAHDVPVRLLADQRQPEQVDQGLLQGGPGDAERLLGQRALTTVIGVRPLSSPVYGRVRKGGCPLDRGSKPTDQRGGSPGPGSPAPRRRPPPCTSRGTPRAAPPRRSARSVPRRSAAPPRCGCRARHQPVVPAVQPEQRQPADDTVLGDGLERPGERLDGGRFMGPCQTSGSAA